MTDKFKGILECKDIYEYIDKNFDKYIEEERNYLKIRSISFSGEGIKNGAEATAKYIKAIGGEVEIVPSKVRKHPVVYGKLKSKNPKAKTLIFYSWYDVVDVIPEEWTFPPFAAEIVDAEKVRLPAEFGKVIVARGAIDKKGSTLPIILTLGAIKEVTGDVPVNVIFVLEGEEEIMSPSLRPFVGDHYDELNMADAVWSPGSFQQFPSGLLVIHGGYNGFVQLNLEIKGGMWGGTTDQRKVWSGYNIWPDQPLLRLMHAISTMISRDGRALIEGFDENWMPPTPKEREQLERSKAQFDKTTIRDDLTAVNRFLGGRSGQEIFEEYLTEYSYPQIIPIKINSPHMDLSFIPMEAKARLDCRFGTNTTTEECLQKVRKHLYKCGFPEIEVSATDRHEPSRTPISADVVQALVKTAEIHGVEWAFWPSSPGTSPLYLFSRPPLNKPIVCGSLGHGGRFHAPDEYYTVEGIRNKMKGTITFLHEYANM